MRVLWLLLAVISACGEHAAEGLHGHHEGEADAAASGHAHVAPHGGTLVVLGDEIAHVELLLDAETGTLTAYLLDAEAEGPVRVAAEGLALEVTAGETELSLTLEAQASALTGETVGDTSQFQGRSDQLIGLQSFHAVLRSFTLLGQTLEDVSFPFPEGNEEHGEEESDHHELEEHAGD